MKKIQEQLSIKTVSAQEAICKAKNLIGNSEDLTHNPEGDEYIRGMVELIIEMFTVTKGDPIDLKENLTEYFIAEKSTKNHKNKRRYWWED